MTNTQIWIFENKGFLSRLVSVQWSMPTTAPALRKRTDYASYRAIETLAETKPDQPHLIRAGITLMMAGVALNTVRNY